MKKLIILLLVLMAAVFSVNATSSDTLTIKAYKKTKSNSGTLEMKVIDALTGTLATFPEGSTQEDSSIDMTRYVKTYLGNIDNSYTTNDLTRKAAFSVHVSGNYKGTFTVTTSIKSLAYYDESGSRDTDNYITTKFFFIDYQLLFTSEDTANVEYTKTDSEGSTIKYKDTIESGGVKADGGDVASGKIPAVEVTPVKDSEIDAAHTIKFSWTVDTKKWDEASEQWSTVSDSSSDYISHYWDVRATFSMVLEEGSTTTDYSYKSTELPKGIYKAPVTVTISST